MTLLVNSLPQSGKAGSFVTLTLERVGRGGGGGGEKKKRKTEGNVGGDMVEVRVQRGKRFEVRMSRSKHQAGSVEV